MINLYLKVPETVKAENMVNTVCSHLVGNRGFVENDIVITNPDNNNVFCISLGDRYSNILEISAHICGVTIKENVQYYLGEENSSGQKANSKEHLLNMISNRIDELLEQDVNMIDITLGYES